MGLFGGGNGGLEFSDRAMRALALLNGDYGAAATINAQGAKNRAQAAALLKQQQLGERLDRMGAFGGASRSGVLTHQDQFNGPVITDAPPAFPTPQRLPSFRDLSPVLAKAAAGGVDTTDLVSVLDKAQPDIQIGPGGEAFDKRDPTVLGRTFSNPTVVNGVLVDENDKSKLGQRVGGANLANNGQFTYDQNDPTNANRFFPQLDKGQGPLYDGNGRVVGIRTMDGVIKSIADMKQAETMGQKAGELQFAGPIAQATSRGSAEGSAPYDFINAPTTTGAPRVMSKAQAAGGEFVGQSPTEALAAKAQAQAGLDLPRAAAQAQEALGLIDKIKAHPGLDSRTGMWSLAPAIPGTAGADFEAMQAQLAGKVFLEAYSTLKGGGQITEVEGKKAQEAIARLNTRQTKESYLSAMDDLRSVIEKGAQRAQGAAGSAAKPAGTPPSRDAVAAELRRRGLLK